MKRFLAILMAVMLSMLATVAAADPARFLKSDKNADYHWRHLQQHIGSQNCMVSGNYIKIRPEAGSDRAIGHLEKADAFTLDDIQNGWAKITVVFHAGTSPDSRVGMAGWVNADYVECQCSSDEYYNGPARTTYSLATVTAKTGNLREEPTKGAPNHAKIKQGEQVEVLGEYTGKDKKTWYRVRYGEKVGFLRSDMVEITQTGIPEASVGQSALSASAADAPAAAQTVVPGSPASGPDEDSYAVMLDNHADTAADGAWQNEYYQFITSGEYKRMVASKLLETMGEWGAAINEISFRFALYDMNRDGLPELIVYAGDGPEQLDIYTLSSETVVHLGAMGGDNFFQWIFYDLDPGSPELLATLGGPAMSIERCTYTDGIFRNQEIGHTLVSSDGLETVGLELFISDDALYSRLYQNLVKGREDFVTLTFSQGSAFLTSLQSDLPQSGAETETADNRQAQFLTQTYASWGDAYYHFIADQIYEQIGYPDYYLDNYEYVWLTDSSYKLEYQGEDSDPVHFVLFDLNNDGIPELFAYNGEGSMAGNTYHVYTFRDGRMKYVGSLGVRELMLGYDPERRYPGLVQTDGLGGEYYTQYWYMEDDRIKSELIEIESYYSDPDAVVPDYESAPKITRETNNVDLYEWAKHETGVGLSSYTYHDVMSMGWEQFVASTIGANSVPAQAAAEPAN